MIKLVCISDTHNNEDWMFHDIPDGDVILHAGDVMTCGYDPQDLFDFLNFYEKLPHDHKLLTGGNHDRFLEDDPETFQEIMAKYPSITYLQDKAVTISGYKFYGSPWQPWFYDWAFNLERNGEDLREKWDLIPPDVDVLITHGPPHGHLDRVQEGTRVGCELLAKRVEKIKPKVHVFGHIHEAYGVKYSRDDNGELETLFVNASICNRSYRPVNEPILIDMEAFNDPSRQLLGKMYKRG